MIIIHIKIFRNNGEGITSPCGGKGICGKCGVRIYTGDVDITDRDREFFYNRYRNLYTTENHVMRHVELYRRIFNGNSN